MPPLSVINVGGLRWFIECAAPLLPVMARGKNWTKKREREGREGKENNAIKVDAGSADSPEKNVSPKSMFVLHGETKIILLFFLFFSSCGCLSVSFETILIKVRGKKKPQTSCEKERGGVSKFSTTIHYAYPVRKKITIYCVGHAPLLRTTSRTDDDGANKCDLKLAKNVWIFF